MFKLLVISLFAAMCCIAAASDKKTTLTIHSTDQKTAITMKLVEGWKTSPSKDAGTTIEIPMSGVNVQIWALSQKTIDEAAKEVRNLVVGQFTEFKITATKTITVANSPGKQITMSGEEADDGDPGNADVYIFSVEGKVYMICAHGEHDSAMKNRLFLTALLKSVKKSTD
jgi:hypothetical protein